MQIDVFVARAIIVPHHRKPAIRECGHLRRVLRSRIRFVIEQRILPQRVRIEIVALAVDIPFAATHVRPHHDDFAAIGGDLGLLLRHERTVIVDEQVDPHLAAIGAHALKIDVAVLRIAGRAEVLPHHPEHARGIGHHGRCKLLRGQGVVHAHIGAEKHSIAGHPLHVDVVAARARILPHRERPAVGR